MKPTWLAFATLGIGSTLSLAALGGDGPSDNATPTNATPTRAIHQPSNGRLVATAAMSTARAAHTATTLPDGRVLAVGGFLEKGSARGAEIYESDAGRFSALSPMITTRHSHTATLLPDGKVLIAGGYGEGTITLKTAELFDPARNSLFTRCC